MFRKAVNRLLNRARVVLASKRSVKFNHNIFCRRMACTDSVYKDIGEFRVFAWSISGIETSVVIKKPADGFSCCFDMGYSNRQTVSCDDVLISHGHMDHIAAVPQHIKKRELQGLRPASYYVPEHLIQPLTEACSQFYIMSENTPHLKTPQIYAVKPDEKIKLRRSYHAVAFPTVHRVKSQGYMVYHTKRTLKSEFMELPPKEIGAMVQKGVNVHDRISIPEIAYTGDTTFEVFTNSPYTTPADLLKVKLLIVEATYMNDDCDYDERVSQARQWGHIHLSEIYENAELFKDVENILLIHMSDKYSVKYIEEKVYENIPESLQNKIHISTLAKERYI